MEAVFLEKEKAYHMLWKDGLQIKLGVQVRDGRQALSLDPELAYSGQGGVSTVIALGIDNGTSPVVRLV